MDVAHGARGEDWQIRVNAAGEIVAWGAHLEAIFGYREDEVLGRKVDFFIPRPLRALHWRGFNRAVDRGHMRHPGKRFRSVALRKNGGVVAFRALDVLNFADDGSVAGVTGNILGHGWRSLMVRLPRS